MPHPSLNGTKPDLSTAKPEQLAVIFPLSEELYGEISRESETDFHFLFGEEFLRAYREKTRPAGSDDRVSDASSP